MQTLWAILSSLLLLAVAALLMTAALAPYIAFAVLLFTLFFGSVASVVTCAKIFVGITLGYKLVDFGIKLGQKFALRKKSENQPEQEQATQAPAAEPQVVAA